MTPADALYYCGVALQVAAFTFGMRPITLGIGLTIYSVALTIFAVGWRTG